MKCYGFISIHVKRFILVLILSTFSPSVLAQNPSSPSPISGESEVIRVETRLVTLPVSVRDRAGKYLGDLRREDFRIFEEGVEQRIAHFESLDQPISIILLMDYSVSIRSDLQDIRTIGVAFLDQLRSEDWVRAVAFGNDVQVLFGDNRNRQLLREAILKTPLMGNTALYDAVLFTLRHLIQPGAGRKAIILFTDGVDTYSNKGADEESLRLANEQGAPVYVVKYGEWPDRESARGREGRLYLRELAEKSGGTFYFAGSRESMGRVLNKVAEELRSQYTMGYYPADGAKPGERRKIKVGVKRQGVVVKARNSYVRGL